jgi:hypothetical protein
VIENLPDPPAYDGAWVGAVLPALLGDADAGVLPAPARGPGRAVLLVVDGLGWTMVEPGRTPNLAGLEGGPVDTTVPSTTSTALTSITTGRVPAEHGVIGYRMRVGGQMLTTLSWNPDKGPEPERVQPYPPFAGREVSVVTCAEFDGSGLTRAHLRGGQLRGWKAPSTLVEHTVRMVDGGAPTVYAYYDALDKVGHEFGPDSEYAARELVAVDRLVGELRAELPSSCALVVTADHGMVAAPPAAQHDLERPLAGLVAAWSGEGRLRSLYARPGKSGRLRDACREVYGERAWVLTRDELIERGWLGGRPSAEVAGRVGDVVLASADEATFIAPDLRREAQLRGAHGSLTHAELRVPLVAGRGTRGQRG